MDYVVALRIVVQPRHRLATAAGAGCAVLASGAQASISSPVNRDALSFGVDFVQVFQAVNAAGCYSQGIPPIGAGVALLCPMFMSITAPDSNWFIALSLVRHGALDDDLRAPLDKADAFSMPSGGVKLVAARRGNATAIDGADPMGFEFAALHNLEALQS